MVCTLLNKDPHGLPVASQTKDQGSLVYCFRHYGRSSLEVQRLENNFSLIYMLKRAAVTQRRENT